MDAWPAPLTEPPISATPRAIEMGKEKLRLLGEGARGIRVGVRGGGCSGLAYVFDFAREVRPERDLVMDLDGLVVVCDRKSVEHLRGSVLEWSDALVGHGFRWRNPNAKSLCGCGDSFAT